MPLVERTCILGRIKNGAPPFGGAPVVSAGPPVAFQTLFRRGMKPISREEMTPEMMEYTADIFPVIARIGQETSELIQELKAAGIS